jgi:hypothetical protein
MILQKRQFGTEIPSLFPRNHESQLEIDAFLYCRRCCYANTEGPNNCFHTLKYNSK